MSVCVETSQTLVPVQSVVVSANVNVTEVSTSACQPIVSSVGVNVDTINDIKKEAQTDHQPTNKNLTKLVVASQQHRIQSGAQVLQKVVNSPLITVLNSTGPLTVVKSLCVTSVVSSAPQYTLVNTAAPLNATNTVGKPPTITVLNCGALSSPVTVVKAINTQVVDKSATEVVAAAVLPSNVANIPVTPALIENRGHNVFLKGNGPDVDSAPRSHKLLAATNFSTTNVITNIPTTGKACPANGQRNKLKIISNVQITPQQNVMLNRTPNIAQPRLNMPARQKLVGINSASTPIKIIQKSPNNLIKATVNPGLKSPTEKSPKLVQQHALQKGPIKSLPPSTFLSKPQQGIKTLSPQQKSIPGQVQRTTSGLRTIPPQKPQKVQMKTNYIGKHAVQAQKVSKQSTHSKLKSVRSPPPSMYGYHQPPLHEKQLTFNQALTAQIIETLSNTSTPPPSSRFDLLSSRYDSAFTCPDKQMPENGKVEDKAKSGLDALSLICQAVLLDHNYNATLPSESPTRPPPPIITQAQVNGIPSTNLYSTMQNKRRLPTLPSNLPTSSHSCGVLGTNSIGPLLAALPNRDEYAASDVSDNSDKKHDTESEETDTAPEAEDVKNEDHYGDYVTRCICGFLHDDGYMVECDKCKVWQHVQCVVKNRQIPDEYLCEVCDPSKPIDRQKARLAQQQWIRERQLIEPKIRKEAKLKDALRQKDNVTDSDSSDGERSVRNNNVNVKRTTPGLGRRKSENTKTPKKESKEPIKRQKRKEKKIVKRKAKTQVKQQPPPQSHSDDENQDTWSTHLPQLRQWIEKYEEAVTNHYSPELRARISSIRVNGTHVGSNIAYDVTVCKCRIHTQPLTEIKYLVSTSQLPPSTPVIELRGKYMLSTQHRNSGGSLTTRQHTQKPGPFLFFYRLHKDNTEVCVDTRTYGNSARFIRRSCKPNAELQHCIEKGVLHLYIVSLTNVEKNCELTIRHESHDLAAVGTTQIACACGRPDECAVNKIPVKKNGEVAEVTRKRRGRRTVSSSGPAPRLKEQAAIPPSEPVVIPSLPSPLKPSPAEEIKEEVIEEKVEETDQEELKIEEAKEEPVEVKEAEEHVEEKPEEKPAEIKKEEEEEHVVEEELNPVSPLPLSSIGKIEVKKEKPPKEEKMSPPTTPISTRRSSHQRLDKEESSVKDEVKPQTIKSASRKLSREERKLEAILRAIAQMEKADQKKQEHQAKQAHRRESEPGPNLKEEEKIEPATKIKRRRRRGRARTTSSNAQTRRSRLNSTDSYMTSGDENLLSPNESSLNRSSTRDATDKAAGLLLALSNGDSENKTTPPRDHDSNSNSAFSSPETPQLSSACLLVQAAVEPLEVGFKFPKTKKGLMNEWLNKTPDSAQSGSSISPSVFLPHLSQIMDDAINAANRNMSSTNLSDSPSQRGGNAKKRWLRQAISEDHSSDCPIGRPDSPTMCEAVAPPKKRKLPRESLSNDNSPPSTPTSTGPAKFIDTPRTSQEGSVEIVYSGTEGDSPWHTLESDAELKERAVKMQLEFGRTVNLTTAEKPFRDVSVFRDPRLRREEGMFSSSEHLIGTVEKTLSMFGFTSDKSEVSTPEKKKVKLSITEYRQRKKLTSDKTDDGEVELEPQNIEDNSLESFKSEAITKPRSRSSSSSSTCSSSDNLSSSDIVLKAPVFNCEPTELERQREMSNLRLKKAFGLAIDEDTRKSSVVDMKSILSCDLESKINPVNPTTFNFGALCELSMSPTLRAPPTPDRAYTPVLPSVQQLDQELVKADVVKEDEVDAIADETTEVEEEMQVDQEPETVATEEVKANTEMKNGTSNENVGNMFYTPDDEEKTTTTTFEEADPVNYVPPFNNPVYPNSNFASFTSTIDDDSRYQSRNPSPPPDLETTTFGVS
ncbi:microtubule-associated protein 1B isoform X1 [Euwallacea fornicatus]|uniref:microtubule-associated protein 1B isoform X1 n=1 Tax=Euwallacea fornicatus TaxID=995702 RepID=UPI00338E18F2